MRLFSLAVGATVAALLAPSTLGASNVTFRSALSTWSKQIAADASTVALAARQRHPRLMTSAAIRFHRDALRARANLAAQKVSASRLRKSRLKALSAFTYYARAGTEWAASGRFRLSHQRTRAIAAAQAGARDAHTGSRLLLAAASLAH